VNYTIISKKKGRKWEDMEIEFTSLPGFRLRLVAIYDCDDELLYVTNIWDLAPRDTHHCYEQRWDIEILNKDLKYNRVKHGLFRPCLHGRKSNLKINHFMGKNLNARAHSDLYYPDSLSAHSSLQDFFIIRSFPCGKSKDC
jgi:hypothetical protein